MNWDNKEVRMIYKGAHRHTALLLGGVPASTHSPDCFMAHLLSSIESPHTGHAGRPQQAHQQVAETDIRNTQLQR